MNNVFFSSNYISREKNIYLYIRQKQNTWTWNDSWAVDDMNDLIVETRCNFNKQKNLKLKIFFSQLYY